MSLLIKALDKAQEEARAAKAKQPKVKRSEQEPVSPIETDNSAKHQSSPLGETVVMPGSLLSNSAYEKVVAANALELELSPSIKADIALKPINEIQSGFEKNQAVHSTQSNHIETDVSKSGINKSSIKSTSASVPSVATTSKALAFSKINDNSDAIKKNAANVFAAKRIEANHQNSKIAFIVGVGVLFLSAIAAYFYQWAESESDLKFLAKRPVMSAPAALSVQQSEIVSLPSTNQMRSEPSLIAEIPDSESKNPQDVTEAANVAALKILKAETAINNLRLAQNEKMSDVDEAEKSVRSFKAPRQSESKMIDVEPIASKSASIQVSKTTEPAGVNPVLMRAYEAYVAGNDSDAIKLYKQVLQRDVRNVDALLGLGAIAQRQGRLQDANGWYGKVLELEPKNSIALGFNLAATMESQPPNDVNNESRIKNMLAKQPDDANLHATLGNFYADSNQWSAAQQAYFEAYRLNASADNAFNLAISLDQLGKPKLALPYYQRALQLSQTTRTNIDKAALEARISAIQ